MDVANVRVWQWMMIGALAGAAVGYAWTGMPRDVKRSGDDRFFAASVRQSGFRDKMKLPQQVRNITVLEPEIDPSNVKIYPVEFETMQTLRFTRGRNNAGNNTATPKPAEPEWIKTGIYARTPFEGDMDIKQFLTKYKMPFTDRSGSGAMIPVYYGAGLGFGAVGVVWPAMILGMIKIGMVPPPPPREKKVKAKKKVALPEPEDDMLVKDGDRKVNAGDIAKLDALNDQLEAQVGKGLSAGGARAGAANAGEPVSVLMTHGASAAVSDPTASPAAPPTEQEKKDYAGEYYPVVKPHGKPH